MLELAMGLLSIQGLGMVNVYGLNLTSRGVVFIKSQKFHDIVSPDEV